MPWSWAEVAVQMGYFSGDMWDLINPRCHLVLEVLSYWLEAPNAK